MTTAELLQRLLDHSNPILPTYALNHIDALNTNDPGDLRNLEILAPLMAQHIVATQQHQLRISTTLAPLGALINTLIQHPGDHT